MVADAVKVTISD